MSLFESTSTQNEQPNFQLGELVMLDDSSFDFRLVYPVQNDQFSRGIVTDIENLENSDIGCVFSVSNDLTEFPNKQDDKVSDEHRLKYYSDVEESDLISLLHFIHLFSGMNKQEIAKCFDCKATTFSWEFENGNLSEVTNHARSFAKTLIYIDRGIAEDNYELLQQLKKGTKIIDYLMSKNYGKVEEYVGEGRGRVFLSDEMTDDAIKHNVPEHFGRKLLKDFEVNKEIYEAELANE